MAFFNQDLASSGVPDLPDEPHHPPCSFNLDTKNTINGWSLQGTATQPTATAVSGSITLPWGPVEVA